MEMRVQALNNKGEILENAEVLVDDIAVGRTPNAIASLSGAIWKSYTIKVRCDGYNDVQFSAAKEPKWLMIFLGAWFLWFLWLWAYGVKELQTVVMYKKADLSDKPENINIAQYRQFLGRTWQDVLKENDLGAYISVFENQKITDIDTVLSLTEQDWEKIGLKALGDRRRLIKVLHDKLDSGAEFGLSKSELSVPANGINQSFEQALRINQDITTQPPDADLSKDKSFDQELKKIENIAIQPPVGNMAEKPEDRYNFLREDDRIYRALKFKAKKGFFKHILPSSWIITIGFYGLLALLILVVSGAFVSQTNSQLLMIIVSNLTIIVIPIILLIIGTKNRVKYMKEKKMWKECTGNGKQKIEDVYMEFEKLENDFLGL
jgi:hypothetical protein